MHCASSGENLIDGLNPNCLKVVQTHWSSRRPAPDPTLSVCLRSMGTLWQIRLITCLRS